MILTPICMVRQWGQFLQIHINSFSEGHRSLFWSRVGSDVENSFEFQCPDITLKGFNTPGTYSFWTVGPEGESARVNAYIRCDSTADIIKRILSYVTNQRLKERWAVLILLKLQQDAETDSQAPIAEIIYRQMHSASKMQEYEKDLFQELLLIAEKYYNSSNIAMNSSLKTFPVITYGGKFNLKTGADISKIRLSKVLLDGKTEYLPPYKSKTVSLENVFDIPAAEDSFCHIIPLAQDEKSWLNFFIHYQFDEDIAASLWSQAVAANDLFNQTVLDDDMNLSMSDVEMSGEDKKNWFLAQSKNPFDFVIPRPEIIEATDTFCSVKIPGYDFIQQSQQDFYISTREADLLLRDDFDNLTLIDDETVLINRAKYYLDGNTFFYVQSGDGRIISPVMRHDFNDFSSQDFRDKARLLQFDIYERRLRNVLRYYMPAAEQYVADILQRLRTISEANIDEIYLFLISEIVRTYPEKNDVNKLLFSILEDWNSNFNVDTDFFPDTISYYYATDRIVFPGKKDDYLLCIGTMDHDSKDATPNIQYIHSSSAHSIEVQVRSMKFYFMYAIDLTTFHRSGFFFVDTYNHVDPLIYKSNITFERR